MGEVQRAHAKGGVIERYFGLAAQDTNVRTEIVAGLTAFLTMVYIVFVNPNILGQAGMDKGAVFVATWHCGGGKHLRDGSLRQLPDRARARHGPQRLLRLQVVLTYKFT